MGKSNMTKGISFLLYFLSIITFLFIGLVYVKISGAAEGQGLAGGAIVLFNALIFAFIGLLAALFIAYRSSIKTIKILCFVMLGLLIASFLYLRASKIKSDLEKENQAYHQKQPKPLQASLAKYEVSNTQYENTKMGLGFFKPDLTKKALYFYSRPNLQKSVQDHVPTDSVVFQKAERGDYEIISAPPWLVPEHLKLDYGILYFKLEAIGDDFATIQVNKTSGQKAYVNKHAGHVLHWSTFLLSVHSVEFKDELAQVYIKPMDHSSVVNQSFDFLNPLLIQDEWMYVELINENYDSLGNGWIQWRKNNQLQIAYSLLS